jgi:TatD DNase family protein
LLKNTARNRFLVETDGPVRYARCFEDKPALPTSFLASVVSQAAAVLGLSYDEAVQILEENSKAFLGS